MEYWTNRSWTRLWPKTWKPFGSAARFASIAGLCLLLAACTMPDVGIDSDVTVGEAVEEVREAISETVDIELGPPNDDETDETAAGETAAGETVAGDDEAAARLQVPEGFTLNTFHSGLDTPRLMTVGPDGHLYVADRQAGEVVRLPDADGDGMADERQVVASGLNGPHNAEWFEGDLYVATNDAVLRLSDTDGDGDFMDDGEQTVVTDNIPTGGVHTSRTLHFGPDGMLYVATGSSSNIEVETDRRRAAILRFNPDGTIPEDNPFADHEEETMRPVWAQGLRNAVDFLFLPDGRLWATHNGSDMLGDDLPPEEIVVEVEGGEHYGWPYCYTAEMGDVPADAVEVRDERVEFDEWLSDCSEAVPALFTDLAHYAPLGLSYYDATAFPEEYQGNLFVAYHGSWNSTDPRDCRVQMIVVRDGEPVESTPFVTGFRDDDNQDCGDAWGRPADTAVGAQGELYISDDQNGNIYRVVHTGGQ